MKLLALLLVASGWNGSTKALEDRRVTINELHQMVKVMNQRIDLG